MHALLKLIGYLLHKPDADATDTGNAKTDKLAEYRKRFRTSLVGGWTAQNGTFSLMGERLTFYADGTGLHEHFSGSGNHTEFFDWEPVGDFCIRMRSILSESEYPEEGEDEPDEPSEWYEMRYGFATSTNDVHDYIALREVGNDGALHEGFHTGVFDLGYAGEPDGTRRLPRPI